MTNTTNPFVVVDHPTWGATYTALTANEVDLFEAKQAMELKHKMDLAIAKMEAAKAAVAKLPECMQDTSKQFKEGEYEQTLFSTATWFEVARMLKQAKIPSFAGTGGSYRQDYLFTTVPAKLSYSQLMAQMGLFQDYKKSKGVDLAWGIIFYDSLQKRLCYGPSGSIIKNLASLPEIIDKYGEDFQESYGIGNTNFIVGVWIIPSTLSNCKHHHFQYMKYGMVSVDSLIERLDSLATALKSRGLSVQTFLYEFVGTCSWLFIPDTHLKVPEVNLYTLVGHMGNATTGEVTATRKPIQELGSGKLFALSAINLFVSNTSYEVYYEYLDKLISKPDSMKAPVNYNYLKVTWLDSPSSAPYLLRVK